ncbi:MAG: ABC transporter ATP-binding protein [Phycisphaerales bacterium]|nr:ABC transporter ATP-binding protein [Phycisphaerales bacterium]
MHHPLLAIRDLTVSFPGPTGQPRPRAADGVSLTVYPRQTVAVVGESGSGKSITALSILQILPPAAQVERGRILFHPEDNPAPTDLLTLDGPGIRKIRGGRIAMIFQEPMSSLNPVFSIGDQITEAIRLHQPVGRREAERIAAQALAEVGITEPDRRLRQFPHEFSGGMRQRVMIAMALACQPALLLADEPTTALDVTIQAQILELLAGLKGSRGLGILLITHDLGIVARHADVVCVMHGGRVLEYAPVDELFARPLHPYTRGLLACIPRLGHHRDRLVTVREIVEDPAQFQRWPGGLGAGLRAWWPDFAEGAPPELAMIARGHWVAVCRTPGLIGDNNGVDAVAEGAGPDLAYRRSSGARAQPA